MEKGELRALLELAISHHPDCNRYRIGVLTVGGVRICRGCLVAYTISPLIVFIHLFTGWGWSVPHIFFKGDVIVFFSLLAMIPRAVDMFVLTRNVTLKSLSDLFMGMGFGLFIVGMLTTPFALFFKVAVFTAAFIVLGFVAGQRYHNMRRICSTCSYKGNWDFCPGFSKINKWRKKKVTGESAYEVRFPPDMRKSFD